MSNLKRWFGEKWPFAVLAAAFLAVGLLGFGIGYIAAGEAHPAPIIIERQGTVDTSTLR